MFTRRCSERRFFLRPDPETNNTFWYCLGWAAQKHGILLHAAVAMSNHVHICATDPIGVYPDFLRDFNGLLARAMNALRGRWEHFWDASQASAVLLEDDAAQLNKVVYTLANPADLIGAAIAWPGATALPAIVDAMPVVASRPPHFFREADDGGVMPETVTITFQPPPAFAHLPQDQYINLVAQGVARAELAAAHRRGSAHTGLEPSQILAQHWGDSPSNAEPRRQLSPAVACRDKWLRIERLRSNKEFLDLYRRAFEFFRTGLAALFPAGTWLMRLRASITLSTA